VTRRWRSRICRRFAAKSRLIAQGTNLPLGAESCAAGEGFQRADRPSRFEARASRNRYQLEAPIAGFELATGALPSMLLG